MLTRMDDLPKDPVFDKEAKEFLRMLKQSEYKIIEQLSKSLAHISMLYMILTSKIYRNALLKVLNESHVTNNISVDKFTNLVVNIFALNLISFFYDEIGPKGTGHNKALHLIVKYFDTILSQVLIDNRSIVNI